MPRMKPKANRSTEQQAGAAPSPYATEAREGTVSSPPIGQTIATPVPLEPASYPRRILLAVTGMAPQVVTETLYALAVNPRSEAERFLPTEVHLITTAQGAEHARLSLLTGRSAWFRKLREDYKLAEIAFDAAHIHIIADATGRALADIRTREDNERAADFITEQVRALTSDPDAALHVSIAGGRKTMGYYLGYALSLYGRAQDRLSHVLVSAPYENNREFYYPTPYEFDVYIKHGDKEIAYDCRKAEVDLAEIPFVSMRHGIPESLLGGRTSFSATVEAARQVLGPAELVLDLEGKCVKAAGRIFTLPPAELALLSVFARLASQGADAVSAPPKDSPDARWAQRYLSERRTIAGEMADLDGVERALKNGMDGEYFSSHLSKLRSELRRRLGPAATRYLIDDGGARPRRYRLAIAAESIRFERLAGITPEATP
jgi:CRISPR-associated protein (TIGR02584 family)